MAFNEAMIRWSVFDEIEISFLPIGHNHEDIDQSFSWTSPRLKQKNAITLGDLQAEVRQTFNNFTTVTDIRNVANWSGLCT